MSEAIKYIQYPAKSGNAGIKLAVWNRPESHKSVLDTPTRYLLLRDSFVSNSGEISYNFGDQDTFMSCSREYLDKVELVKAHGKLFLKVEILPRITTELANSEAVKADELDELLEDIPVRTTAD